MFIQWTLVIFSVTLISAGSIPERIVGGKPAEITQFPWQVSLYKLGNHCCGGSIYSNEIVITAAHCIETPEFPKIYSVRVGSLTNNTGGQLVEVVEIIRHENYVPKRRHTYNDVAVLRLQSKLILSDNVSPIPLADKAPSAGSPAWVSGFGNIRTNTPGTGNLLYTSLKISDFDQCQNSYKYLTKVQICADAPGKDSCQGDSGGPLVSDGKLVGIVSFGILCARPDYPGVYANVAELKPWILNAIAKLLGTHIADQK
ncbi:trypsin alpha-3-like [Drosophila ficusphila]|uniref:trypsin alpha-3-like n=1 Tax=Drosophila ficusphila TaxID=30025 RepID=UPI0007E64F51|nr:trypsin alpha-3-like [Drosophila ficusphila]